VARGHQPIRNRDGRDLDMTHASKTVLVRQLQDELTREGKVLVAKSLSVDKERVTLQTLMMALLFDLSPEEEP
jgi:type II secretory pathway predicted ATPase ExeA